MSGPEDSKKGSSFCEQKEAKKLSIHWTRCRGAGTAKGMKVFWFFFSKKNTFFLHGALA
jgi:hypothetical protein